VKALGKFVHGCILLGNLSLEILRDKSIDVQSWALQEGNVHTLALQGTKKCTGSTLAPDLSEHMVAFASSIHNPQPPWLLEKSAHSKYRAVCL